MAISNLDDYIGSTKQVANWYSTAARTTTAQAYYDLIDVAGSPRGPLAGASTVNGVVPTDADQGFFPIPAFAGGAKGYLSRVEFSSTLTCRMSLVDVLFKAGAYAFNANQALSAQPSFAARVPNADYAGLELWIECVAASTGSPSVTVTYTNEAGVAGRTTGSVFTGTVFIAGRMFQLPLQLGDKGIQKIESVLFGNATAGTFNVLILRNLWTGRIPTANFAGVDDFLKTGLPEIFDTSALLPLFAMDGTNSGLPELRWEIASK